ncbi:hypothetical protein M404DRAFT_25661 [Pisolithus tinctorius Marx 270]|uniref:Uncharacterized protein n=1 Tax=Pisolithus tinctorius Marx 270 TaxID=870435 RepID=A0A0C3PBH2_PISTI|nr:hypothetical protein M404DRAFT_25661 [Pisolithus tinctorius Marx 270]
MLLPLSLVWPLGLSLLPELPLSSTQCYGLDLAPLSGPWWTRPWFSLGLRPLEPTSPLNRHPLVAECSAVTYPHLILKFANPPDVNPALEHEFACKTPRALAHLTNPRLCRSVSQLTHSPRNLYVREAPSGTS